MTSDTRAHEIHDEHPTDRKAKGEGKGKGRGRGKAKGADERTRHGGRDLIRVVTLALAVAALVKELRTPAADRHWQGVVAGFVPYDFRRPTVARLRERMWNPQAPLVTPRAFGVGWTVNAGKVAELVRRHTPSAG